MIASIEQLYAFYYTPSPPLQPSALSSSSPESSPSTNNGWNVYNPREEFARMGLGTRTKAWRFTDINKDYTVSRLNGVRVLQLILGSLVLSNLPSKARGSFADLRRSAGLCIEIPE